MAQIVWIGGSPGVNRVETIELPADIESGQVLTAKIGLKSISYTFPDGPLREDVAAAFVALWEEKAEEITEFSAVEIADNGDGSFTLSAETEGVPFEVTFLIGDGENEIQVITLDDTVVGGTFALTFDGQKTAPIDFDSSAAELQAALEALSNIESGDVAISGDDAGPWTVEFQGDLAATDVALLLVDKTLLEGINEEQTITLGSATGGTFTASYEDQTTGAIAFDATAGTLQAALEALSTIGAGNVSVTGSAGGPWTVEFIGDKRGTDVELITVDGANLTGVLDVTIDQTTPGGDGANESWQVMLYNQSAIKGILTIGGDASVTSGTFTIKIESSGPTVWMETGPIPFDATAAEVVDAFESTVYGKADGGDYPLCFVAVESGGGGALSDGNDYILLMHPVVGDGAEDYTLTIDNSLMVGGGYAESGSGVLGTLTATEPTNFTSFYLDIDGEETDDIPFNASAATIKAALEGLPNIGAGNVIVTTSAPTDSYEPFVLKIEFVGELANQDTGFTVDIGTHNGVAVTNEEFNLTAGNAGTSEVQTLSIAGAPGSGTFGLRYDDEDTPLLGYDSSAAEIEAALEALPTVGAGNVDCSGGDLPGTPIVITFANALSGVDLAPIEVIYGVTAETVAGTGSPGMSVKTTQTKLTSLVVTENSGPNDWNTPTNWDTGTLPENGDTVVIPDGDNIYYGLDQSDLSLALLEIHDSDTLVGLSRRTDDDEIEYLPRFLKLSVTKIVVGLGGNGGSQRINLEPLNSDVEIVVHSSASGTDDEEAVMIRSENSANTANLTVLNGQVGIATGPKDEAYFQKITQRGGIVHIGSNVELEEIERTGGQITAYQTLLNGLLTI